MKVYQVGPADWESLKAARELARLDGVEPLAGEEKFSAKEWRRLGGEGAWFIVEGKEGILGLASGTEVGGVVRVRSVWVSSAHRGAGIGTKLIRAVESWAAGMELESLWVELPGPTCPAAPFYHSLGFKNQPVGEVFGVSKELV